MGNVAGDGGFAHAVGANQNDVGGVLDKVDAHHLFNRIPVALRRPGPVEVSQGLEAPQMGIRHAPLQPETSALLLFPLKQRDDPVALLDLIPVRE